MTTLDPTPNWLRKFQPLMLLMPLVLIGLFFWVGYRQSEAFRAAVMQHGQQNVSEILRPGPRDSLFTAEQRIRIEQWRTLAVLEQQTLARRYQQAGLLLVSRIFTKYLGFLTGMIMAIAGAWFIIGRIREEESRVGGSFGNGKASVRSSSPGIIFGVLGTLLIVLNILHHKGVETVDAPLYLHPANTLMLRPGALELDNTTTRGLLHKHLDQDGKKIDRSSIPQE